MPELDEMIEVVIIQNLPGQMTVGFCYQAQLIRIISAEIKIPVVFAENAEVKSIGMQMGKEDGT